MNQTASENRSAEHFSAYIVLADGSFANVGAPTLAALSLIVGKLRPTEAVVGQAVAQTETKPGNAKAEKTATPEKSKPAATAEGTGSVDKKDAAPEVKKDDEGVLDYTVLQVAVFKLAALNKDVTIEIRDSFGVKNFKDLPEGKRREALAKVEAKIAELTAAEEVA